MELQFIYDALLEEDEICGLIDEKASILQHVEHGHKLKIYGRRNTGKTSLLKNVIIPKWRKENPKGVCIYSDLMSVNSIDQISELITVAFNKGYNKTFGFKSTFEGLVKILKGLRPSATVNTEGKISISFLTEQGEKLIHFSKIFENIKILSKEKNIPFLIVLDEFQQIHHIQGAEALLRDSFQNLPSSIPIVVMGSKFHVLSEIFSRPNAPFANWGFTVDFRDIPYRTYCKYIQDRFTTKKLKLSLDNSIFLQDEAFRCPETINRVCAYIMLKNHDKAIGIEEINEGIHLLIETSQSQYEQLLSNFTLEEMAVLRAFANKKQVTTPTGKDFVALTNLTAPGVNKILKRLINKSIVYRQDNPKKFFLSDPLLFHYLNEFRIIK